jgi:hypothetical protein
MSGPVSFKPYPADIYTPDVLVFELADVLVAKRLRFSDGDFLNIANDIPYKEIQFSGRKVGAGLKLDLHYRR